MNKISRYLGLKDSHPTMIKLQKLSDLADELKISFDFSENGTYVEDQDFPDKNFIMYDLETDSGVMQFPPALEFRITYTNPAYLAEEKRLREELDEKNRVRREQEAEARRIKQEKIEEERKALLARQAIETERKEREQLAALKAKYPDAH